MMMSIKSKIQGLTFPLRVALTERSKSLPPSIHGAEVQCTSTVHYTTRHCVGGETGREGREHRKRDARAGQHGSFARCYGCVGEE